MKNVKKIVHIVLGLVLVTLGLAGLVLPILNGIILLLLGFILLSFESAFIQSRLEKIAHRYHPIGTLYDKLDMWMKRFFR